jgi:hypothetical protein
VRANAPCMQSRQLHASLHAFAQQAGAALAGRVAGGDEIGFEVVEEGARGSRPGLYCYEPLIGEFIDRNWRELLALPAAHDAQMALAQLGGLEDYVDTYAGEHRGGVPICQDALRCFLRRVFDGAGEDFELAPERFEPAYRELQQGTEEPAEIAVLALLRGIGCESPEIALSDEVLLAPLGQLDVLPPDPAWRREQGPAIVVALVPRQGPAGVEDALAQLRDLQTSLRLYGPGISLSPLAWIRAQRSAWRALPIPGGGAGDGTLVISPAQEDELRAFANLITRRRPATGEIAWALERFELGLERDDPLSGLTDHLLALRALLEPEGPRSGRIAGRIAALCAQPQERMAVTEHVAHAISLEQSLVSGVSVGEDAYALTAEIEQHLRALLRDVICGHLDCDLVALADSLLIEQEEVAERPVKQRAPRSPRPRELEPAELFDAAFGEDDYCATEGAPTVLSPGGLTSK